jgi:hypothetical protein
MNFLKRLFSRKTEAVQENNHAATNPNNIQSTEYFNERYMQTDIEAGMLEGCLKMIEGYFVGAKVERKIESPIHHPINLDQTDQEGFGFVLYCKAFGMSEAEATLFLAYAFSDFLIKKYGFTLYKDAQPEHPLRGMTLKYDNNGVVLSLYPYEYAAKVLQGNQTFAALEEQINTQLANLPSLDDLLNPGKQQ